MTTGSLSAGLDLVYEALPSPPGYLPSRSHRLVYDYITEIVPENGHTTQEIERWWRFCWWIESLGPIGGGSPSESDTGGGE